MEVLYGYLCVKDDLGPKFDMYELLAFWNGCVNIRYDGVFPLMKEIDKFTDFNRYLGIGISCYDEDMARLKFPLKLVSVDFMGSYEDVRSYSSSCSVHGLDVVYR